MGCFAKQPAHPKVVSRSPPTMNTGKPSHPECPVSPHDRTKGKGRRPKGAANADRDTSPSIKSGVDQHGTRVTVRIVLRQANQENISATRTEGEHRNRSIVAAPQYRFTPQWTPSFHPPPRRGPAPLLAREDLSMTQRIAHARNRRRVPVSPMMGTCIQPYTGPLTDTTCHTACRNRRLLPQDHSRK